MPVINLSPQPLSSKQKQCLMCEIQNRGLITNLLIVTVVTGQTCVLFLCLVDKLYMWRRECCRSTTLCSCRAARDDEDEEVEGEEEEGEEVEDGNSCSCDDG